MQDRLEETHAQYAGKTSPLNDSHRARYLLNGLVTCGCCGGGYTITGKDRYGCYRRKTQGKQECGNSRTITREKLETRVLARLRQGLMTTSFAAQFAAEVERLLKETPEDGATDKARIELHSEAAQLLQPAGPMRESAPWGAGLSLLQISLVAGAGFEPAAFRL
ncbi:zinc ribbon domain-containing protein [Paracoccus sp. T5]